MAAKYKEKRETIDKINMRKEKKLLSYQLNYLLKLRRLNTITMRLANTIKKP